ncbi:uncharacterized protein N7483_005961 [Penicillium malachiteum]|uniref:uncharacterized protein n=1 Tax=Penicillium malachiteum TaxID=1324776 RepID=UPI002546F46F|nr:uncharacterized protein N7483_005961 [Penicillium malachiteum]KAJ5731453.1 hypothetical protein N7483_005961 [Penicillium malachiteum]
MATMLVSLRQPDDAPPPIQDSITIKSPTIDASEELWDIDHEPPKNISSEQREPWMNWKNDQLGTQNLEFAAKIRSLQKRPTIDQVKIASDLNYLRQVITSWVCWLPPCKQFSQNWQAVNQYLVKLEAPSLDEARFPEIIPLIPLEFLMFAISSIIWKVLFSPILTGASPQEREYLEKIERAIESFKRKRNCSVGPESIAIWRSDTCEAISTFDGHTEHLSMNCKLAVNRITEILKVAGFSEDDLEVGEIGSLERKVTQPMAQITTKLQCSPANYAWRWNFPSQIVRKRHLKEIKPHDPNVHTTVSRPLVSYANIADEDIIGYSMFTIFQHWSRLCGERSFEKWDFVTLNT